MSLVNEALKRARTQAAIQQSANNPLSHLAAPSHYSEPKKSYVPFVLMGLFACCFVGLVSAAVLHLRKPAIEGGPGVTPIVSLQASQPTPVVQPRVSLPPPPLPPATLDPAASPSPAPLESVEVAAATPLPAKEPAVPIENAEAPSPAPVLPSLVEGKVYLQALDFPDVPKVRLDGILWSDKAPIALVNGISVAPGDDLGGISIVAIEPKRVKFEALGKRFFIRLP